MWWRFLTFCVLVCFVLFVVLSCIHGRPVIHLFFRRCCEEDIENDQVIEDFENNVLRERLTSADIIVEENDNIVTELEDIVEDMRARVNVHNPNSRCNITDAGEQKDEKQSKSESKIQNGNKVKELVHELLDLAANNDTFSDLLLDSHETVDKKRMTSEDEVVVQFNSVEKNNSIQATMANNKKSMTSQDEPVIQLGAVQKNNSILATAVNGPDAEARPEEPLSILEEFKQENTKVGQGVPTEMHLKQSEKNR